jgi:hypothetical protein
MLPRKRIRFFRVRAVLNVAAVVLATSSVSSAQTLDPQELCNPDPAVNTFSTTVDNDFFPLPAGQLWVYGGKDGSDQIGLQITVLGGRRETFYKRSHNVSTVRVRETEWVDDNRNGVIDNGEELLEISINYYAQTQDGTVCYFGEDVDIYADGEVVSHEGAWRADDPGNAPGIFMPADPEVGMTFQQEVAPGVAEDTATILSEDRTVTTPADTFTDTIGVRDFNPLDGTRSTKAYASGVGLIQDDKLLLLSY